MTSAFPRQTNVDYAPRKRADLTVHASSQNDALQALSSGTAQSILGTLDSDPRTPSEIADAVDTSIQNVNYHLKRLEESGLVEPIDTWYSRKGREMTVYALAAEELVVQFGAGDGGS